LTDLNLKFAGENICDQEVGISSSYLAIRPILQSLELQFASASQLSDQSLYSLLVSVQNLLALRRLVFKFKREMQFDNKTLFDLVEGPIILKQLLSLNFSYETDLRFGYIHARLPEI